LTTAQFDVIRSLLHRISGIELRAGKEALVQARLVRSIQTLDLADFDAYLEHVQADRSGRALSDMVDALTTNETSFFREARHFDLLATRVLPPLLADRRRIRIWSAGCSTGEEAYTLAMNARQVLGGRSTPQARILATDLSALALKRARTATYSEAVVARVPAAYRASAFRLASTTPPHAYRVTDELRSMVHFARLNLIDRWPMSRPMDVIFCRNVMIYFDEATQQRLIARFADLLAPGGHLFVGHSEGLSSTTHGLRYVQPAVYAK
jgi:chemotaxis protein methyltransferase CheR